MLELDAARCQAELEARMKLEREKAESEEHRKRQAMIMMQGLLADLQSNTITDLHDFRGLKLDSYRVKILCDGLEANESCRGINLSGQALTDDTISPLCSVLTRNTSIRSLILDQNQLTCASLSFLAQTVEANKSLRFLSLRFNDLSYSDPDLESSTVFARTISRNEGLTSIDLSFCRLGKDFFRELCVNLHHHKTIMSVDITGNEFDDESWEDIVKICSSNRARKIQDEPRALVECARQQREDILSAKWRSVKMKKLGMIKELNEKRSQLYSGKIEVAKSNFEQQESMREKIGQPLLNAALERLAKVQQTESKQVKKSSSKNS